MVISMRGSNNLLDLNQIELVFFNKPFLFRIIW